MSKVQVSSLFSKSSYSRKLGIAITNNENKTVISGLVGSSFSIVISEVFNDVNRPFLIVLNDKEEAAYHLNDLENLLGEKNVLFYPGSYRRPYQIEETDNTNILLRSEVITFSKRASGYETIIAGFFRELIRFKTSDLNRMLVLSVSSI